MNKAASRRVGEARARPLADTVLEHIWRERRISRADIARQFGLARSTVSQIIDAMLATGLVAEIGTGETSGGRPPILLEFQSDARRLLGVDIGSAHVAVVVTDLHGNVLSWQEKKHPARIDPDGTLALVSELSDKAIASTVTTRKPLVGIGLAVPSPVDPQRPEWLSETVVPAWRGQSGLQRLQKRYRVPAFVDNDANLGALAEHWWGAGRNIDDLIFIKMAHGIGAGLILDGKLYRGAAGVAGEFGHMVIDPNGAACMCGANGCLATFIGTSGLEARASELRKAHQESMLTDLDLALQDITKAAASGDQLALHIAQEAANALGIAVASWINLMNPGVVILGGSPEHLGEAFLDLLRAKVQSSTLMARLAAVQIRPGELSDQAVAIGAATLALEKALESPELFAGSRRSMQN